MEEPSKEYDAAFIDGLKEGKRQLQVDLIDAEKEIEELREALLQHREDLHQSSTRPCPTCRKSAKILGLKVPDQCARRRWDKEALKGGK